MNYESGAQYDQFRADRAKAAHMRNAPHEPIPNFDPESPDAIMCQYSKPDNAPLDPARKELASLIKVRDEAAATVTVKKNALAKASAQAANLRRDLDAARNSAAANTAAQAKALAASFESGDEPPAPQQPVATGNVDQLQQQLDVATGARDRLQLDVTEADAELNKRQEQVVASAFSVMRSDGDRIAAEIQALQERVDILRLDIGILNNFGGGFVVKIGDTTKLERPQLLTARSVATLERPAEVQYPANQIIRADVAQRWKNYFDALCLSADALFGCS